MNSLSRKPAGILVVAWIFIIVGCLGILSSCLLAFRSEVAFALAQLIGSVITLALGLALRTFKRWILIMMLAYLGAVIVTGALSGHWLAAIAAMLFLLYLLRIRDSFGSPSATPME
jgi:hypothetical protein